VPDVPGLVISVAPYFTVSASGSISADASWHPALFLDITRSPSRNSNFLQFYSKADASATGTASLTLEGGLDVQVSVAKQAGLEAKLGPEITASASVTESGSAAAQACLDVVSSIKASVSLFAHFLSASAAVDLYQGEFYKSQLFHRCTSSGSPRGSGSDTHATGGSGGPARGAPLATGGYQGPTTAETTGGVAHTWSDYVHAGGAQGPDMGANQTVAIACKIVGFKVADGDTWWYRVAASPWNGAYYVSADAFYNNGASSGSLRGTPLVDPAVPDCSNSAGSPPTPVTPPTEPATPTAAGTYGETTGGVTHTWTNYTNAGGTQGPSVPSNSTVQIACVVQGFRVADGNTNWYRIASSPWSGAYYASADAFYNNGATSGSLNGTPYVDPSIPACSGGSPGGGSAPPPGGPPAAQTYAETTGGVTHTWTNYSNAGGNEGPTIPLHTTVQISCVVQGFRVSDGNTNWYRIASSPWSDSYYASADAFYNNGATSGSLNGTPYVDPAIPSC